MQNDQNKDQQSWSDAELDRGRLLFSRAWVFQKSCVEISQFPNDDCREFAFAGRSNVGKSSLINALTNQKGLARTSNTPGRTQQLNIFEPEHDVPLRLVDMPGYGYARASKSDIKIWTKLIHAYLKGRQSLYRVFLLIDARHGLKDNDLELMDELDQAAVSYQIVLTKADKIKASQLAEIEKKTYAACAKRPAAFPFLIATSSEKGRGLPELRAEIAGFVDSQA